MDSDCRCLDRHPPFVLCLSSSPLSAVSPVGAAAGGGGCANRRTSTLSFSYRGSLPEKRRRDLIPTNPSKPIAANTTELGSGTGVKRNACGHTGKVTAPCENAEENGDFQDDEAREIARDPDLAQIVAAWPSLAGPIKRAMFALIG